jgi:hypothetical protein
MSAPLVALQDDDGTLVLVVSRMQRARVDYECTDCGQDIIAGDLYRYEWSRVRGERTNVVQRVHVPGCYDEGD